MNKSDDQTEKSSHSQIPSRQKEPYGAIFPVGATLG
jgi:hypothetical protein